MRDAMGGTVVLVIIVVFIVIALGYMAFNVNYTKAFRMKNKIISVYEDYEGNCEGECSTIIKKYAESIGYSTGNKLTCDTAAGYKMDSYKLYCYKTVDVTPSDLDDDVVQDSPKYYYKIVTKISVEVPIINNVLDLKYFQITGDTRSFNLKNKRG